MAQKTTIESWERFTVTTLLQGLIVLACLLTLLPSINGLTRGFDITDEAYALLLASHPHDFPIFVSASHWVTSWLWNATGNLLLYRVTGFCILLGGAFLLAAGVVRTAESSKFPLLAGYNNKLVIFASCAIAALHWDCYGVKVFFTPSYNLFAAAGSYAAIGITLLTGGRVMVWRLLVGAIIGIVFLCKFPTGITLLIAVLTVMLVFESTWRTRCIGAVLVVVAMVATMILFASLQMPLAEVSTHFKLGLSFYATALPEPLSERLLRNYTELSGQWAFIWEQFGAPLKLLLIFAVFPYRIIAFIGIALLIKTLLLGGYLIGGSIDTDRLNLNVSSLLVIMLMFLLAVFPYWLRSFKIIILSAVLFFQPYLVAIGTSNSLPPQILASLAAWGVLMGIFMTARDLTEPRRIVALSLCTLFTIVTACQIITSHVFPAYHGKYAMVDQTHPVQIGALGTIDVDHESRDFFIGLDKAVKTCAIEPGRPFLGFYNILGVALAIQAVPVMTPWLLAPEQAKPWLAAAEAEKLQHALIAVQLLPDGGLPEIPAVITRFPAQYRLCGTVTYPYQHQVIQLWAPIQP